MRYFVVVDVVVVVVAVVKVVAVVRMHMSHHLCSLSISRDRLNIKFQPIDGRMD